MNEPQLILTLPHGTVTATSLDIEGLAHHLSPGSGKHFRARSIMVDLATDGQKPSFSYLDEGGWRDPYADTVKALASVTGGNKTKTALSNGAFSSVPLSAYKSCHLVKTGGDTLQLGEPRELISYANHSYSEHLTTDQVAQTIGRPATGTRVPRLYMVISPIQFVMLSNLTPEEYAWYATHRPGKIFRQVMFAELGHEELHMAALSRFTNAKKELTENPTKKTKSIVFEDCIDQIPFQHWVGYHQKAEGGLYVGDRNHLVLYPFPTVISRSWDKVEG